MNTCSVEGCERPKKTRGYCQTHYVRLWRSGSVGNAEITTPAATPNTCSVEGCERPTKTRNLCSMHYHRWRRHGDPLGGYLGRGTADVGYIGAHHRVRETRGKASAWACDGCGLSAGVWAYAGSDDTFRRSDARGRHFSSRPEDYVPLCRACHAVKDRDRLIKGMGCKAELCDRSHFGQGLCSMHYKRLWKLDALPPKIALRGSRDITYVAAHGRVKRVRGYASTHLCSALCGEVAREWAYLRLGRDPDLVIDEQGRQYSLNLERYAPMCSACHRGYDANHRQTG